MESVLLRFFLVFGLLGLPASSQESNSAFAEPQSVSGGPPEERIAPETVISREPVKTQLERAAARSFVKNWQMKDFDGLLAVGLEGNRDYENGHKMFGLATCYVCHRFNREGGTMGPDLTRVAAKFSPRDLLQHIIYPSDEISDRYAQMIFTKTDGSRLVGRIMNLSGDQYWISVELMDPDNIVRVDVDQIVDISPSPVSTMPPGLINTLTDDDVLDLLAFMLSGGNSDDPMFQE